MVCKFGWWRASCGGADRLHRKAARKIERERRRVLAEKLAAAAKKRAADEERRRWKAMQKAMGTWVKVSTLIDLLLPFSLLSHFLSLALPGGDSCVVSCDYCSTCTKKFV